MKTPELALHRADSRWHVNLGWLDTHHTFSFSEYYHPERMWFGALRVLNDDIVFGWEWFGMHPHADMEIVTIPLEWMLMHRDNMGNSGMIKRSEVQVMSAGKGLFHSEFNASNYLPVKLLQIWIIPHTLGVTPRYGQEKVYDESKKNVLQEIVSPNGKLWIHQDAWLHMGRFDEWKTMEYEIKKEGNGVYAFVIGGMVETGGIRLDRRDGLGISGTDKIVFRTEKPSELLLIEIPMAA